MNTNSIGRILQKVGSTMSRGGTRGGTRATGTRTARGRGTRTTGRGGGIGGMLKRFMR